MKSSLLNIKRYLLLTMAAMMTTVAMLNAFMPRVVLAQSGFAVGPAELNVTVPEKSSNSTYVYITSYLDGELVVGTENLPFRVEPETIPITATDRNRKVELVVHGNTSLTAGQYSGKLTFLLPIASNVSIGVKIKTNITQESSPEPKGFLDEILDLVRQNYIIIIAVAGIIVALILGIFIGKKSKRTSDIGSTQAQTLVSSKRRVKKQLFHNDRLFTCGDACNREPKCGARGLSNNLA